jgi:hypothetical protein
MTLVELPLNLIIENSSPYQCVWLLVDEVYCWLLEHVGPGSRSGGWSGDQAWQWNYRYSGRLQGPADNLIAFSDPKDAMLFKLTWA